MLINLIKILSGVAWIVLATLLARDIQRTKARGELTEKISPVKSGIIGFVANFFDAIGVGSYAIAVTLNSVFKQIPIILLPGTLAVGIGMLPTLIEIIVGVTIIPVDPVTVIVVAVASLIGGWFGARIATLFTEKQVRLVLGPILFIVGLIMVQKVYAAYFGIDAGADQTGTIGVVGIKLVIAGIGAFIIGILQAWGLGYFAPTLALMLMLGMQAISIYPVMYAGCGAGLVGAANKFIKEGAYAKKASIFMAIGGVIGVCLALTLLVFISSFDVRALNALVALILLYLGSDMFFKGIKTKPNKMEPVNS